MEQLPAQAPKPPLVEDPRLTRQVKLRFALISGFLLLALVLLFWVGSKGHKTQPSLSSPPAPPAAAKPTLKLFVAGFSNPTAIVSTNQAGDKRLFVLSRDGNIRIINAGAKVEAEPFLDISAKVLSDGEMGLLGMAFSPNYAKDGNFFINYIDKGQNSTIARYHVSASSNKADAISERILLSLKQPYPNHNGGALVFGPDGYLYAALGDGGSAGDPDNRAQNLNSLLGKILRLDVSTLPYKIPSSNPFVNQAGKLPEIWDYGLRNPWRISFDRQTHELYIADVGQGEIEELDVEKSGLGGQNYGWRCFEGNQAFNPRGCQARDHYVFPVLEYDHGSGRCSITGGYVYRGSRYPALAGKYFYGDYCGGQLYYAAKQNGQWQSTMALNTSYKLSTFGQDNQGELYAADFATGNIYHLENAGQ